MRVGVVAAWRAVALVVAALPIGWVTLARAGSPDAAAPPVDADPCAEVRSLVARWQLGPSWGAVPSRAEILAAAARCPNDDRARILATLSRVERQAAPVTPPRAVPAPAAAPSPSPLGDGTPPSSAPEAARSLPAPGGPPRGPQPEVPEPGNAFAATRTEHFDFRWAEKTRENWSLGDTQRVIGEYLEEAYREVGDLLDVHPTTRIPVVFYAPEPSEQGDGTKPRASAYWDGTALRVTSALKSALPIRDQLFHAYTHVVVSQLPGASRPPAWLEEGLAELIERRTEFGVEQAVNPPQSLIRSIAARTRSGGLAPFSAQSRSLVQSGMSCRERRGSYSRAYLAAVYLHEQKGMDGIVRIVHELARGRPYPEAMSLVYPRGSAGFEADFERWLQDQAH